ncbi:hypothetical protein EIN_486240 [Entamoeba invadens IP1]|uniref:Uncharacterized protein n=1 Tax=Entamoeba invadens IP1 TaxID=370355 RepID=A0A0A1U4L8_ENTIV|nr:hypothetical protein EIN_486240 [Entamoeba invadens IP1]ELP89202.1 hypothetical protein EIN_486240 [Entamoeba invadens IP1]|eukprot:XP_004255973.1 hypothetical protein EIN_486240 [Entamoeba invadens IP1]
MSPPSAMNKCQKAYGNSVNAVKERAQKDKTAFQHGFLLALINQNARITLKRPKKVSMRTSTIPKIVMLEIQASRVDVLALASSFCAKVHEKEITEGVPQQTADRRFNKNIIAFTQNFIFDTCLELGYFFDSKLSKNSMKSIQTERIDNVYANGSFFASQNDILFIGRKINAYFTELLKNKRTVVVEQNDQFISSLLENYFNIAGMAF